MRRVCRLLICAALIAATAVLGAPATAGATGAGGAGPTELAPATQAQIDAAGRVALAIADRTQAAKELRARGGVETSPQPLGGTKWRVGYTQAGRRVLEIDVDLHGSRIEAVWKGAKADFPLARGYPGWFGGHVTAWWVWLPLCAVFLLLFVDRRRLRRIVHLDLAVIVVGFGVSQWFFQRGAIGLSVPLAYIPLLYLLVRMMLLARGHARERLEPVVGMRTLAVVLALLCAFRIGLNVSDTNNHDYVGWGPVGSTVVDVGYAGVVGADRLQQGLELYTPTAHLDTYGPLNYVAYIPFERIWPFRGVWDSLPAAHAAAIAFDLLTLLGFFVLGLRLRPGRAGKTLGLAMCCAWAACPYTSYVLMSNTNDALVAAAVVWALVVFRSALLSGLVIGLGTAAKFIPAALLPGLIRVRREHGWRAALICGAAFLAVILVVAFAFAPPEGVDLLWRHTVARQAGSSSPFSVWGMWDWIGWLRAPLEALTLLGAAAAALGRDRDVGQAAAIGAALVIAVELTALHWIYFYILWFLPLVFVALFVPTGARAHRS